jgi:CO/xanthine dehydrogenase FAD-binding subunit
VSDEVGRAPSSGGATRFQSFDPACQEPSTACTAGVRDACDRSLEGEDCVTLAAATAACEAARCFNCGCVAVSPSDLAPVLVALDATIVTTSREIPAADFFAPAPRGSTVLEAGEIVLEVLVPREAGERHSAFRKFRLRNAIDFPIVSAAVSFRVRHGSIADPRVVLGAVAPVPVRAAAAEAALHGRPVEEVTAAAFARHVAACAVEGVRPLSGSAYKAQIAGALVARAIGEAAQAPTRGGRKR